jgi:hypothetical protein
MTFEYHVSTHGVDAGTGSSDHPFATIGFAAGIARAGDTVIVHDGIYREQVNPQYSGLSDIERITYKAADGEHPVISGSEEIVEWEHVEGSVWKAVVDNSLFGNFNPFEREIFGDWLTRPDIHKNEAPKHLGDVYLDGRSLFEVSKLSSVMNPVQRHTDTDDAIGIECSIEDSEWTTRVWFARVNEQTTEIWANFAGATPSEHTIEISVRECCFFPERTHINYITVEGFELRNAATPWAPPTAEQRGLIGPNWSTGWVIQNNQIHDSKCSGICLGMPYGLGDNDWYRHDRKTGYQYQLEAVFKGLRHGWEKGVVGSHLVSNNEVYNCGQSAINGHMGCAFSTIEHNHVHHIGLKREYFGWEVAGIKFHAALDMSIRDNYVHDCSLALWLDWQAQGIRISGNVFNKNVRDLMIEVSHGPYIVDNNIFGSDFTFQNFSQGGAFINNLICGKLDLIPVLDRSTPYHFAHTTDVAGSAFVSGGDDRWMNNIFAPANGLADIPNAPNAGGSLGLSAYDGYPASLVEYSCNIVNERESGGQGGGDPRPVQPVYVHSNVYSSGANAWNREGDALDANGVAAHLEEQKDGSVVMTLSVPEELSSHVVDRISTSDLGTPRIVEAEYENPDGSPLIFDKDICGEEREQRAVPGPFANLKAGEQRMMVWAWTQGAL